MPKFSILIIEDEKNIQTFMRKILIRHDSVSYTHLTLPTIA
mgnify:CR=1 FL=1